MQISDKPIHQVTEVLPRSDTGQRPAPAHRSGDENRSDRVSLSPESRLFGALREAVDAAPDVRLDRVAELRQRLLAGTYRVPAEQIAEAILTDQHAPTGPEGA